MIGVFTIFLFLNPKKHHNLDLLKWQKFFNLNKKENERRTDLVFVIILIVIVILIITVIVIYNRLVKLRNMVKSSWSDIDVQLKKRFDLVPNLVEIVKGYASHERKVFEKVTEARSLAMKANSPEEIAKAESMLRDTLKTLFALAEAYPELKANENFSKLQTQLQELENSI